MNQKKRSKFYCLSAWGMAGLCLLLLLQPLVLTGHWELLDRISFVGLLLSILPAVAFLVLNIFFRREKRWGLWVINGLLLIFAMIPILTVGSLNALENGSRADHRAVSQLGLSHVSASLEARYDDHGGFHGDGVSMSVYALDREQAIEQLESAPGWRKGPLDETVTTLAYGRKNGENGTQGPYLTDLDGRMLVPKKNWTYWYFEDRQADQKGEVRYSTDAVLDRNSLNFTLALYDGAGRLYVFQMDT